MRIWTLMVKEWEEAVRNTLIVVSTVVPAVLFVAIPIVTLKVGNVGFNVGGPVPPSPALKRMVLDQFLLMFMIIPVMLPTTMVAYSVVGEKVNRSLEPLLATPLSVEEILLGKGLAGLLPGVGISWLAYLALAGGLYFLVSPETVREVLNLKWLLALVLVGPLFALFTTLLVLIVSSRTTDPRAAQQVGAMVVIPVVALTIGNAAGRILVGPLSMIGGAALLLVASLVMLRLAVRIFQRETILTRWR